MVVEGTRAAPVDQSFGSRQRRRHKVRAADSAGGGEAHQVVGMTGGGKLFLPHIFQQVVSYFTLWAARINSCHILREIPDKVPLLDSPLRELAPGQAATHPALGKGVSAAVAASYGLFELGVEIQHGH